MVSQGEDWASTPWIAAKPDGAVVGWYDYGYMAVYSVRSADLTVRDGALAAVNPQCLKEGGLASGSPRGLQLLRPSGHGLPPAASTTCWCAPAGGKRALEPSEC